MQSDRELLSVQGDTNHIERLCFDQSGQRLATIATKNNERDRIVRIWDTLTEYLVHKASFPKEVTYNVVMPLNNVLMFANEGKTLLAAGGSGTYEIVTWTASNWARTATE